MPSLEVRNITTCLHQQMGIFPHAFLAVWNITTCLHQQWGILPHAFMRQYQRYDCVWQCCELLLARSQSPPRVHGNSAGQWCKMHDVWLTEVCVWDGRYNGPIIRPPATGTKAATLMHLSMYIQRSLVYPKDRQEGVGVSLTVLWSRNLQMLHFLVLLPPFIKRQKHRVKGDWYKNPSPIHCGLSSESDPGDTPHTNTYSCPICPVHIYLNKKKQMVTIDWCFIHIFQVPYTADLHASYHDYI